MKIGDLVRHKQDGDIGILLSMARICEGGKAELYEILWRRDGNLGLMYYGRQGENLEVINA